MKYNTPASPDGEHALANYLVGVVQDMLTGGRMHVVLGANSSTITEVHVDELAAKVLRQLDIEVKESRTLRPPNNFQVKIGSLYGQDGSENGLLAALRNQTNFNRAFDSVVVKEENAFPNEAPTHPTSGVANQNPVPVIARPVISGRAISSEVIKSL